MEMDDEGCQICEECGEGVPMETIKHHRLRRHDKRVFQCDECGLTITGSGYSKHEAHKDRQL